MPSRKSWSGIAGGWLPVAVWLGAIIVIPRLVALPLPTGNGQSRLGFEFVRFGIHAAEYAILAFLLVRALRAGELSHATPWRAVDWTTAGLVIAITVFAGTVDEMQQGFAPNRQPSPWDVAGDATGAALALAAIRMSHGRRTRRRSLP